MRKLFSRLALVALLIFSANSAFGQIYLDGVAQTSLGGQDTYGNEYRQSATINLILYPRSVEVRWDTPHVRSGAQSQYGPYTNAPYELTNNGIIEYAGVHGDYDLELGYPYISTTLSNACSRVGISSNPFSDMIREIVPATGSRIFNNGWITTLDVTGSGQVLNTSAAAGTGYATIDTANVTDNGWVFNGGYNIGSSIMGDVSVTGDGHVVNVGSGVISFASVADNGRVSNSGGWISAVDVTGNGRLDNSGDGFGFLSYPYNIQEVSLNGGTVNNIGGIENLIYTEGIYNGRQAEDHMGDILSGTGTIGTLTLAGDSANNTGDWGIVENIVFHENGNGILHISAFAEPAPAGDMGLMSFSSTPGMAFSSAIQAQNIDFANGNIVLDLTGLGDNLGAFYNMFLDGFSLDALFGSDVDEEGLLSLQVVMGSLDWQSDLFGLLNDGMFEDGWRYTDTGLLWNVASDGNGSVPEPATLVILGLGLAGLGLARRRRK